MSEAIIGINGMMCSGCEKKVTTALSALKGVESVKASTEEKRAVVVSEKPLSERAIKKAVKDLGFEVTGIEQH